MLLNRVASTRCIDAREFTCNIILDYERDRAAQFSIVTAFRNNIEIFPSN